MWRSISLVLLTLFALAGSVFWPSMPQPLDYHAFADTRNLLGVPNFFNVFSNAGFLIVGLWGIWIACRRAVFGHSCERWPYLLFFLGMILTAVGSSYYHWAPSNQTLFWDRLPMTIAFGSLIGAQIAERIERRAGLVGTAIFIVVGVTSALYWHLTEMAGRGNVIPYGIFQAYSVIVLLLLAFMPSRYTHAAAIFWVFGCYVLAKLFEQYDKQIFEMLSVSGHSLKHVAAAAAGYVVAAMITRRAPGLVL